MPIETVLAAAKAADEPAEFTAHPFAADLATDVELPVPAAALFAHYQVKGEAGDIVELPVADGSQVRRVLLYGVGDAGPEDLRKAGAALVNRAKGRGSLTIEAPEGGAADALIEGALLAAYTFTMSDSGTRPVEKIVVTGATPEAAFRGQALAHATAVARDLVNTPASTKTPLWLAERATEIAEAVGLKVRVDTTLTDFGGIRAVGQGSVNPPCLIELTYEPESWDRHVVLAGKGITFDSGGISLKPTEGMKTMKTDMAGGAAVIGAMSALAAFGARVKVTGLIACAENAFSGSAQRPSDVITQYGGRTVEVLNTDAEGRLVLADALAYADAHLDPDVLVDIATLTGAAKVALGTRYGALFATDDALAGELLAAAGRSGDLMWRMPLIDDYLGVLESDVADLANVDKKWAGAAGSIGAALFLREFTGSRPWAHLDIAGPARGDKGGTGFGVRLLLDWLAS